MNKIYYDNKMLMQNIREGLQSTQEESRKLWDNYRSMCINGHLDGYRKREKELNNKSQLLMTMEEITHNNILHIQQKLLYELLEIYKSKYVKSRIGQKTKEKIQKEFESHILNKYNIEVYSYINTYITYNDEEEVKIAVYFKDFYYEYELKQEEIRHNRTTNDSYLYYYNEVNYTEVEEVEQKAQEIRAKYNESMDKIRELKRQIESIRDENNQENICCLKATRISTKDY
jgi:hypothetical protein